MYTNIVIACHMYTNIVIVCHQTYKNSMPCYDMYFILFYSFIFFVFNFFVLLFFAVRAHTQPLSDARPTHAHTCAHARCLTHFRVHAKKGVSLKLFAIKGASCVFVRRGITVRLHPPCNLQCCRGTRRPRTRCIHAHTTRRTSCSASYCGRRALAHGGCVS